MIQNMSQPTLYRDSVSPSTVLSSSSTQKFSAHTTAMIQRQIALTMTNFSRMKIVEEKKLSIFLFLY